MTDIIDRLLSAAKMAHEPNVLSRLNDTDLLDAVEEIKRLRNIVNPGDAAAYEEAQANVERLSSEVSGYLQVLDELNITVVFAPEGVRWYTSTVSEDQKHE